MASQYEFFATIKLEAICVFCNVMQCLCDCDEVFIVTKGDHMYLSGIDVEGWPNSVIKLKARIFSEYHASYENSYKLPSPGIKPIFKCLTKITKLTLYVKRNSDRIVFEIGDQTADLMKFSRNYANLANFGTLVSDIDPKDCKNKWIVDPLIVKNWLNELGRTVNDITLYHTLDVLHIEAVDTMTEDEANSMESDLKVHFETEEDRTLTKLNLFQMPMLFNSENEFIKMEAMMYGSRAGSTDPNSVRIPQATMDVLERNEHLEDIEMLNIPEGGLISVEDRMLLQ
ncbi:11368_t:CDS:2 [Dentiscutata heterogama]|uniref:11368_t:CDS:1 n=1 Tax=Dentiscutata heterogama TaxID=1316150 RepID=A0ACA9KMY0_9GLOM|nr:11368_t:CDS:2 [Dentiscutata heterogama]